MTGRGRRRGVFEGLPRVIYRRTRRRYLDACTALVVLNGVVVAGFGPVKPALYVAVHGNELALFAACSVAGYVAEGLVAAAYLRRSSKPVRAWLAGARDDAVLAEAWSAAASLPLGLVRRPLLYVIGAVGAGAASLVL